MLKSTFARAYYALVMLTLCAVLQLHGNNAVAQSRLIHYWNFNSFTGTFHSSWFPTIGADYSIIDTTRARVAYKWVSGTSATYSGYFDNVATVATDYDTVNLRLGATGGNGFRFRNPTDSARFYFYIPTTNYQNIVVKYASQTSSTTSGPTYELFDYSTDSGTTWKTTGLSTLQDSAWLVYHLTTIKITDPLANNNPKLVLRIRDSVHNTGTSGNIRFDNITVEGDTIVSGKLIHFWNFNNFSGVYKTSCPSNTGCALGNGTASPCSGFYPIAADYSAIDTSKAKVLFAEAAGTSLCNPTYFDFVALGSPDYDTVNAWFGVSPGNGVRMRNPNDSTMFLWYMPTTGYKNIALRYGTESSSIASGDSVQAFDYSVDSGATWRISGMNKVYDSAWTVFNPISVLYTDPAINNNPKFVFRIKLKGKNTGASGNNRFDNISLQGDSIITASPTITTTAATYGPLCNSAPNNISVAFTTTGTITGTYAVQITNANGTFPTNTTSNIIGTGTTSPITALIPAGTTPGTTYRVRVVNSYPVVYGSDNGSNIILSGIAPPISGSTTACTGNTDTLADGSIGGVWTSSTASVATIGGTSGVVYGVTTGTTSITYTVGAGCTAYTTVTVVASPAAVTGTTNVCPGGTTTLSDATGAGTWSSNATGIATVVSGTGVVSGISAGTARVTFTLTSNGCPAFATVTVNPLPAAITGTAVVCVGATTNLTDIGGGAWSSSNTSLATVTGTGVVTGVSAGNPLITYTLPTGCLVTAVTTVNAVPAAISGNPNGCVGVSMTYSDASAFGVWSSSNTTVAAVGSGTGLVSSTAVGTSTISYTISNGCSATKLLTVNPLPTSITGTNFVCIGLTATLSNASTGGTWSSSNTALASIDPAAGIVTGIAAGNPTITYTLPTGCIATSTFTVNPLPAAIGGLGSVYCIGSSTNLSDASSGGTWSSSNTTVATVDATTGVVTGLAAGTAVVTYTLPTGCIATINENVSSTPATITGPVNACVGANANYSDVTAFGAWSSSDYTIADIGSGTGIVTGVAAGTATITYQLSSFCLTTKTITVNNPPAAITGTPVVCAGGSTTTLSDSTAGGFWLSSVPFLATVDATTGVLTGVAAGNPAISYILPSGCSSSITATVNPLPAPIGGSTAVYCIGSTTTLFDFSGGGTWSSSNTSVATIDASTGSLIGTGAGAAVITYTLPTGCIATLNENISSTPAPITGSAHACIGTTTNLSDVTAFGAWASSDLTIANIGSGTGVVTGVAAGTTTITYELSPACLITEVVTVNPSPAAITGTTNVCAGSATTLSDASGGGTWSSAVPALASVNASTGVVAGIISSTVAISYTLPTGCQTSTTVTVNPLSGITGPANICLGSPTSLSGTITGGTWISSHPAVASIDTFAGTINGLTLGTSIISYTLPTGCLSTYTVTVSPPPYPITGTTHVCEGLTTTLSAAGGGGWFSSDITTATVGFGTGIVTGIVAGTATITYSLGTSCITTAVVTVNTSPAAIAGPGHVCVGAAITLSDATGVGSWSSSSSLVSVGSATGMVSGLTAGIANVTYTLPGACIATSSVTVDPISAVLGSAQVCAGSMITLSDATTGGSWSASTTSVATIDATTGILTGVAAGTTNITYSMPSGCWSSASVLVNPLPTTYTVIGGGSYCSGLTGVHVNLSFSDTGVKYQLYQGSVVFGSPLAGTGAGLDYGAITAAGTYTVAATDTITGCTTGMAGFATVTIIPSFVPSVTVTTSTSDTICNGTSTTFTAVPAHGGTTPGYTWKVNGITVGSTSSVYTYAPSNGDVVTVTLATSAACTFPLTVSDTVNMTVNPYYLPAVSIFGGRVEDTLCGSNSVNLIAAPVNGGPSPVVRWYVNGSYITTSPTYSFTPTNGDVVYCKMHSSYMCLLADTVRSNSVAMRVYAVFIPTVTITASAGISVAPQQVDTFTAVALGAGPAPLYQWLLDGSPVPGATSSQWVRNNFHRGDSVTCVVRGTGICGHPSFNSLILDVTTTSVNNIAGIFDNVRLLPNPNNGSFNLEGFVSDLDVRKADVEITNMLGQVIYKSSLPVQNGSIDAYIQLSNNLANGMYMLRISTGDDNKTFRFVIGR